MTGPNFMISSRSGSAYFPFVLYRKVGETWWRKRPIWSQVDIFKTREEARDWVKQNGRDLPEYL